MLFGEAYGTSFADNGDFHLSGICHFVLYALCDFIRQAFGFGIVDFIGTNDYTQLAAGLDGIGLYYAGIRQGELFEVVETLDIGFHYFTAGAGTGARNGIAHLHDGGKQRCLFHLVVVRAYGVAYFRFLLAAFGNLHAEDCVRQFGFLVRHFAYVVQQPGTAGLLRVQPKFGCHNGAEVGGFACMLQKVLTVARTIFHLTDHADKVGVQAVDTQVDSCALTSFHNLLLNLFAHLVDNLLDSGGVNAAVGHKLVKGQAGDFAAHRVEARQQSR